MSKNEKIMNEKNKKNYEAPVIKEATGMNFNKILWEDFCDNKWCFGCTNCSCR